MRICLYTETALPKIGGQEMVVDSLARQFVIQGQEVTVLAPYPRLPLRPSDDTLPYPVVRHPRFYSTRVLVSWYRFWLRRLYRRSPFDVLHCHGIYPSGYLASLVRERLGVPTLITSHGGDVNPSNVRLRRPVLRGRYVQALERADVLVAISRFTEDGFLRLCPAARRIERIPNGVDTAPYLQKARRPAGLDARIKPQKYFFFLGRLKRRKGVDLILQALTHSELQGVRLVIAGDGEERAVLESLAHNLGVTDRVHFLGSTFGESKTYLLQNALATLVPSRISEAFGLVVLESYAAGTPVIASRLAGLEDLVDPKETGLLMAVESHNDLANGMYQMLAEPERARAMGRQAQLKVPAYRWSAIAQRYLRLFQDLCVKTAYSKGA